MEEEFYAIIKLVSGEEIFSKVHPCDEDDRILLILDDPVVIEKIKESESLLARVKPWIEMSSESLFIIDIKNVLLITETKDKHLIELHNRFIRTKYKKNNNPSIEEQNGYISSVSEARKKLELLYKYNKI